MNVLLYLVRSAIVHPTRGLWKHELRLVIAAEIFFVGGWSLMWACSLDLVPVLPVRACPLLMIIGLGLGALGIPVTARRPPIDVPSPPIAQLVKPLSKNP